jgi:hypothetical protein
MERASELLYFYASACTGDTDKCGRSHGDLPTERRLGERPPKVHRRAFHLSEIRSKGSKIRRCATGSIRLPCFLKMSFVSIPPLAMIFIGTFSPPPTHSVASGALESRTACPVRAGRRKCQYWRASSVLLCLNSQLRIYLQSPRRPASSLATCLSGSRIAWRSH